MFAEYVSYLKDICLRLRREGVVIPVDLNCDATHLDDQVNVLEQFLYFNHVLQVSGSEFKIDNIPGFTDISVEEYLRKVLYERYQQDWARELASLTAQPEDAGVIDKPLNIIGSNVGNSEQLYQMVQDSLGLRSDDVEPEEQQLQFHWGSMSFKPEFDDDEDEQSEEVDNSAYGDEDYGSESEEETFDEADSEEYGSDEVVWMYDDGAENNYSSDETSDSGDDEDYDAEAMLSEPELGEELDESASDDESFESYDELADYEYEPRNSIQSEGSEDEESYSEEDIMSFDSSADEAVEDASDADYGNEDIAAYGDEPSLEDEDADVADFGDEAEVYFEDGGDSADYGDESADYGDESADYGDESADYGDESADEADFGDESYGDEEGAGFELDAESDEDAEAYFGDESAVFDGCDAEDESDLDGDFGDEEPDKTLDDYFDEYSDEAVKAMESRRKSTPIGGLDAFAMSKNTGSPIASSNPFAGSDEQADQITDVVNKGLSALWNAGAKFVTKR